MTLAEMLTLSKGQPVAAPAAAPAPTRRTLAEMMAMVPPKRSAPAPRAAPKSPLGRSMFASDWGDRVRALRPRPAEFVAEPLGRVKDGRPIRIKVLPASGAAKVVEAFETGVPGLVVHKSIKEEGPTLTHAASGKSVVENVPTAGLEDVAQLARAVAAVHPEVDWTLPEAKLIVFLTAEVRNTVDTLIKDPAQLPGRVARVLARAQYEARVRSYWTGEDITEADIVAAFDTEGQIENAGRGGFVDVHGFRYHFGWSQMLGRLTISVDPERATPETYAWGAQGRIREGRTLFTPAIQAALNRWLKRLTTERLERAWAEGLPLLFQSWPAEEAKIVFTVKPAFSAVGRNATSTREEGSKPPLVWEGRNWVNSGCSWYQGVQTARLEEVVPMEAWTGRLTFGLTMEIAAQELGLADGLEGPNAGAEVWLKGRPWVYTGHWRTSEFNEKAGSAARRGVVSFPRFATWSPT